MQNTQMAYLKLQYQVEPSNGADEPHDMLFSHAGVNSVWLTAHRWRWAPQSMRGYRISYPAMFLGRLVNSELHQACLEDL
jgi:hypothetical protein